MLIDYLLTFALFRQVYKKVWEPVDNGQLEVLWNLSKYLKLSANLPTTTLQYSLQIGHCVGLSICHGAMAKTHQIEWWESALVQVALWDGEIASLNTMILLPGASNNKAIPLSLILIRVLNYVKSCQIDNSAYSFSKSGITCLNLMSPATKGFEILEQNKIKSILKSTQFVGYFSKKQLAKLLSGAYIKDRICVIYNTCHAIRIGYSDKDQWVVYDPNYPHRNRNQPLYKQFSKAGAIDEIVRILGYSLHIQISHLDRRKVLPNPVHEYEKMLKNEMADLLKEFGLQQITRVAHHLMPRILNAAKSSKKVANSFAEGLCKLPEKIWRDSKYQSVYNSALQHIAELCPEYLEESLKVASCADNGISLISQGFENFIVESSYACTLIRIAKYKPQLFPKVLDYIEAYTKEKCPIIFAEALNSHYKIENCYANGLSVFDKFVGNHLPRIIAKISEHHDASFYFLSALLYLEKKTNPDGTYYCTMCVEEVCNAKSKNLTSILKLVMMI